MTRTSLLLWLDEYAHVDRLKLRRDDVIPRMRWWEWGWYVTVVVGAAVGTPVFDDWQAGVVDVVPYLRHLPQVVTWPVLGVVYSLGNHLLMPAREARAAAPGEAWLIGGIWLAVSAIGFFAGVNLLI